jgi:hypothetical protein
MNLTLQQIHSMLLAQQNALSQALDETNDPARAKTIVMEMQEVLHRIDLVQNLLFTESSKKLEGTLSGINKANKALSASIKGIDDLAGFLNSVSNFLKAVDQAVDIAKTLAV